MVIGIICFVIAITAFVIAILQFLEKGFLFNNAYIWTSKEEREKMNKKPHYKQSGIVFLLIGIIFMLNSLEVIFKWKWVFPIVIIFAVGTVVYAIVSAIAIEKRNK